MPLGGGFAANTVRFRVSWGRFAGSQDYGAIVRVLRQYAFWAKNAQNGIVKVAVPPFVSDVV
jgi:hypothetical protein